MITKGENTFNTPYCWVCHREFTGNLEEHHIVPRAYGGGNGPVVNLCDTCHTRVHKLASMLSGGKIDKMGLDNDSFQRLHYLADVIVRARLLVKDDPNKRTKLTISLTQKEVFNLEKIKYRYRIKSREEAIKFLIDRIV